MTKLIVGINDLQTTNPDIAKEWHPTKNGDYLPTMVTSGSGRVVWWLGKCGHEWETSVTKRIKYGCPYCNNKKILSGFNDFASKHSDLLEMWDYSKNAVLPYEITECNGKLYWWKCSEGHSFQSRTADIINGHRCPYCSGRKVIPGQNDLLTLYSDLSKQWDYSKNAGLTPNEVKAGSKIKVWWICENGHSWQATIKNRVNGSNCPYCMGTAVETGVNDLSSLYPNLMTEWNYERNADNPSSVACYSNKKYWWLGICGHEWQDTPGHRVAGRGCPICRKQLKTSFPEQALFYYINQQYPDAINGYSDIFENAMEIDIYIPSLNVGIEYDGKAWHNSKKAFEREKRKYDVCKKNGTFLIRVREEYKENILDVCDKAIICSESLDETIKKLRAYIKLEVEINTDKDHATILQRYLTSRKNKTLLVEHPNVSKEWSYTNNGSLTPDMFTSGSGEIVWWVCPNGHEYQMKINEKTQGSGCPICSNHRLLIGYNDLASQSPNIACEWHKSKNVDIHPDQVLSTSTYKAWWQCKNGHEWQAKVGDRTRRNSGCPYCSNKKVLKGFNDLATICPDLMIEWLYEKNSDIYPDAITKSSKKNVWWKCSSCGHIWQTAIVTRTAGHGCPECANKARVYHLNMINEK